MPMNPWTPTTNPKELRRLGKTLEELGELVAALGRTVCQGLDGVDPKSGEANIDKITKESADVIAQISCNVAAFRLDESAIMSRAQEKQGQMAEWERLVEPKIRFLLCPGSVQSRTDGQVHFITASQLANLYGVSLDECLIAPGPWQNVTAEQQRVLDSLVPLRPRYDGNYSHLGS